MGQDCVMGYVNITDMCHVHVQICHTETVSRIISNTNKIFEDNNSK